MSFRFLKLTNIIINTRQIKYIKVNPEKITINIGHNVGGILMFGSGGLETNDIVVDIEKTDNKEDYKIAKNWIDTL